MRPVQWRPGGLGLGPALALAALLAGCSTASDPPAGGSARADAAPAARLPLPELEPGQSLENVQRLLADWGPGHRYARSDGGTEGWEWSGRDGRRVEALFSGPVLVHSRVSRTWGSGAPAVEGHRLPRLAAGGRLVDLATAIGPGLLVDRVRSAAFDGRSPLVEESYRWRIADRGLDTGLFLLVRVRDGRVLEIRHRWSGR